MRESQFREYLEKRGFDSSEIEDSISTIRDFEKQLKDNKKTLNSISQEDLKNYLIRLISEGTNTPDRLQSLARYFWLIKRNDLYTHLAAVLGGHGVYESIGDRLGQIAGEEKCSDVFDGFITPPLGSDPSSYPPYTQELLNRLSTNLPRKKVLETLIGNHHRIPVEAFSDMKKRWETAKTLEEFLAGEHNQLVAELEGAMKSGRLWYEQEITPEVVEFVRADQTIQNGVLHGDVVLKSKIPFAPAKWLQDRDPKMRRYHACHCQLARDAILTDTSRPLATFCHCSAGYEKLPLEVVLGVPLEVEVLENVLEGGDRCRFAIKIPRQFLRVK